MRLETEPFRDEVARDDVAAVLVACLDEPRSAGVLTYLAGGDERSKRPLAKLT